MVDTGLQNALYQYMLNEGQALGSSLYVNIVLAGASILAFLFMARNLEDPRAKLITVAVMLVPAVSISSYTGLASGLTIDIIEMPANHPEAGSSVDLSAYGEGTVDGVISLWGRYLTWAFSTPFILLALGLIAGSNATKIFTAITFDIAMCLTGLGAALTTSANWARWWWYILSCSFFVVVIAIILAEWPQDAQAAGTAGVFSTLKLLTVVMWFGYPIVWALGVEGVGFLSAGISSWAYSALDIIAKYIFAFLVVNYVVDEPEAVTAGEDYGASLPGVSPADD